VELICIGLNHRTAPVELRDRVTIGAHRLPDALANAASWPGLLEVAIVSTCNRHEVWAVAETADIGATVIRTFLNSFHNIALEVLDPHLYTYLGEAGARHALRVVSGLDSMVLGEPQITGQVKDAFAAARSARTAGFLLDRLYQHALKTHKRVRTETRLGEGAVSVSFVAVELARKIFGDLSDRRVMVLGAGEMSELALQCLEGAGAKSILVSNRTHTKAVELATRHGWQVARWESFPDALVSTDIVISSTGATHPVVRLPMVREAMAKRKNEALFLIDIAAPRDIEPEIAQLYNVFLYNLDDLNAICDENRRQRQSEATAAEAIVETETVAFMQWLASLDVKTIIVQLRNTFDEIRRQELEWLRPKMGEISDRDWETVVKFSGRLTNKLLHKPIATLREGAGGEDNLGALSEATRSLFGLEHESPGEKQLSTAHEASEEEGS
jgi:glutamyl-tRNA reductase